MKILLVVTGLGMGGAEHIVVNLADSFYSKGYHVKIAYLTGDVIVLPENPNIEIIPIELESLKDFPKAYVRLRNVIMNYRPDIVHSHMFHSNLISRLLRLTTDIPKLICSSHSTNEGGKLRMLAYRYTDKLADISTNVSQAAVDVLVAKGAFPSGRIVKVVNGINTNKFQFDSQSRQRIREDLNLDDDIKMLLAVGRLDHQKDYPNLLNAIKLLAESRKDLKLFIAGDGPQKNTLIQLAEELNIQKFVKFLGIRRDIPSLMSASDTFVLSSAWEGFGLVVAEAMACERVVVATDCGGVKEVVGSQNNGFIVEPKNSKALSDKLLLTLNLNKEERKILGANARKHIMDNFSLEANVAAYLNLYNS